MPPGCNYAPGPALPVPLPGKQPDYGPGDEDPDVLQNALRLGGREGRALGIVRFLTQVQGSMQAGGQVLGKGAATYELTIQEAPVCLRAPRPRAARSASAA